MRRVANASHRRVWTCVCGREVKGNGGKASHQRACPVWAAQLLANLEATITRVEAMDPSERWYEYEQLTQPSRRRRVTELRARLGLTDGGGA